MNTRVLPRLQRARVRTSGLQFLLALVLALALWTFVSFSGNPPAQDVFSVPLTITSVPDTLVIVDPATGQPTELDTAVDIQVTGAQLDLRDLTPGSFSASIDLSGLDPGLHSVPIEYTAPNNVRVRSIEPRTINVRLATGATRTVPVEADLRGALPFSFNQGEIDLSADEGVASGPQDLVDSIDRVIAPIDQQGRTSTFTETIPLVAVDRDNNPVSGITLTPDRINVTVRIEPRIDVQRVSVVPNIVGDPATGYVASAIDWSPKSIEVIAPEAITTLSTDPITLTGRTESLTTTVELINPEGIITRLPTNTVTVTVQISPFQVPTINVPLTVPITPINPGTGLTATTQQRFVNITASGTPDQINQLRDPNVVLQATVDLSGLGPGTYPLPVAIQLPPGLQLVGDPPQVSVTITEVPAPTSTSPPSPTATEGD